MQICDIPIDRENRETTEHGTPEFPLAVYHSVMSRNVLGWTSWHWHNEMQLCLVTDGCMEFLVNQNRYRLKTGQGIFINSRFLHAARPADDPDSAYTCLNFSPGFLRFSEGSLPDQKYVRPYLNAPEFAAIPFCGPEPWQQNILADIQTIHRLSEERPFGFEYECAALLTQIWLRLIRNRPVRPGRASFRTVRENERLQMILDYLNTRYGEPLTISDIARQAALSPGECCRFFKRMTGETIFSYLQTFRLSKGIQRLRDTDDSVSEIAYDTGFCSASYFIEVFRKSMHTTPLQYRKSLRESGYSGS